MYDIWHKKDVKQIGRVQVWYALLTGLESKFFPGSPVASSKATYRKGVSIETSTPLGSLQKFEGATGEF